MLNPIKYVNLFLGLKRYEKAAIKVTIIVSAKIALNDRVFSIRERLNSNKQNQFQIFCCTNKELNLITIDRETFNNNIQPYELPKKTFTNCNFTFCFTICIIQ